MQLWQKGVEGSQSSQCTAEKGVCVQSRLEQKHYLSFLKVYLFKNRAGLFVPALPATFSSAAFVLLPEQEEKLVGLVQEQLPLSVRGCFVQKFCLSHSYFCMFLFTSIIKSPQDTFLCHMENNLVCCSKPFKVSSIVTGEM